MDEGDLSEFREEEDFGDQVSAIAPAVIESPTATYKPLTGAALTIDVKQNRNKVADRSSLLMSKFSLTLQTSPTRSGAGIGRDCPPVNEITIPV